MKKYLGLIALLVLSNLAVAQEVENESPKGFKPYSKPDFPGTISVDFGYNFLTNAENLKTEWFGSRTVNIYYQGDFKIGQSKFSFHPGIGLSLERFKFSKKTLTNADDQEQTFDMTVAYVKNTEGAFETAYTPVVNVLPNISSVKKSMLVANYVMLPLELRFSSNRADPNAGFKFGVGGRVGYLFDSHTKIKYKEDDQTKKYKDKQSFGLTKFRYSAMAKLGISWFNLFGYYNLNPLFEKNNDITGNQSSSYTVGITITGF